MDDTDRTQGGQCFFWRIPAHWYAISFKRYDRLWRTDQPRVLEPPPTRKRGRSQAPRWFPAQTMATSGHGRRALESERGQ